LYRSKSGQKRKLERPTSPEYLYAATVAGVVDGDTLDLDIDLGFDVSVRQRIRLARVNSPELDTQAGRAARDFLVAELVSVATVVVQTRKADLHGRYVAEVFVSTKTTTIEDCFKSGVYLNDALATKGHARVVG
jgi:endonuclease YncB( thermonuclease family)